MKLSYERKRRLGGFRRGSGGIDPRVRVDPRVPLLALAITTLLAAPLAAHDTVILRGKAGGETRVTGQIVDYTGRELTVQLPGGTTQRFPAEQVLDVRSPARRSTAKPTSSWLRAGSPMP